MDFVIQSQRNKDHDHSGVTQSCFGPIQTPSNVSCKPDDTAREGSSVFALSTDSGIFYPSQSGSSSRLRFLATEIDLMKETLCHGHEFVSEEHGMKIKFPLLSETSADRYQGSSSTQVIDPDRLHIEPKTIILPTSNHPTYSRPPRRELHRNIVGISSDNAHLARSTEAESHCVAGIISDKGRVYEEGEVTEDWKIRSSSMNAKFDDSPGDENISTFAESCITTSCAHVTKSDIEREEDVRLIRKMSHTPFPVKSSPAAEHQNLLQTVALDRGQETGCGKHAIYNAPQGNRSKIDPSSKKSNNQGLYSLPNIQSNASRAGIFRKSTRDVHKTFRYFFCCGAHRH